MHGIYGLLDYDNYAFVLMHLVFNYGLIFGMIILILISIQYFRYQNRFECEVSQEYIKTFVVCQIDRLDLFT